MPVATKHGGRLAQASARGGDHVRETYPGANVAEALRLVPDVAFPGVFPTVSVRAGRPAPARMPSAGEG